MTEKKSNFFAPSGGVKTPTLTKIGMVIEVVRTILAAPKRHRIRSIVWLLGGAEDLGQNVLLNLNPITP